MKKFILLIILFGSINSYSQSFFKNRISVDYTANFNYSSNYYLDFSTIQYTYVDNDFNINLRVARKVSFEFLTGYKKYKYDYYNLYFNEITYGFGLNIYYGRNYAPTGNSFGLFYKVINYMVDDYNEFYAFLQSKDEDNYKTNTKINYKVSVIGFKLNYIEMLSDKIPLFIKYGGSLSIPISKEIFDASYLKRSFSDYSGQLDDRELLDHFSIKERYKINIGIGYIF
ncbi:hypothetical protein N9544_00635 [Flavobacteriales bacterium]|nr:hypothetical protein [Flavobacteriales bacterium]